MRRSALPVNPPRYATRHSPGFYPGSTPHNAGTGRELWHHPTTQAPHLWPRERAQGRP
ncbi:MAG: hypothetical protein ABF636_05775 [Acetobacter sp.]